MLKLHGGPRNVELLQDLLHTHLLHRLIYDVPHLLFKVMQVERQQVGKCCVLIHCEFHLLKEEKPGLERKYHPLIILSIGGPQVVYQKN